jgi:hypothetical protein
MGRTDQLAGSFEKKLRDNDLCSLQLVERENPNQISYLETGVACTQRFIGRRNAGQIIFFWMGAMGDPGI